MGGPLAGIGTLTGSSSAQLGSVNDAGREARRDANAGDGRLHARGHFFCIGMAKDTLPAAIRLPCESSEA